MASLSIGVIIASLCLFGGISALAECVVDNVDVVDNFDIEKFMGTWYEIGWVPYYFANTSVMLENYAQTYSLDEDGSNVSISVHSRSNGEEKCNEVKRGTMHVTDDPAKMYRVFLNGHTVGIWIIGIDYDSYFVDYGCDVTNDTSGVCITKHGHIWSRKSSLSDDKLEEAYADATGACLEKTDFIPTKHNKDCADEATATVPGAGAGTTAGHRVPLDTMVAAMFLMIITAC